MRINKKWQSTCGSSTTMLSLVSLQTNIGWVQNWSIGSWSRNTKKYANQEINSPKHLRPVNLDNSINKCRNSLMSTRSPTTKETTLKEKWWDSRRTWQQADAENWEDSRAGSSLTSTIRLILLKTCDMTSGIASALSRFKESVF